MGGLIGVLHESRCNGGKDGVIFAEMVQTKSNHVQGNYHEYHDDFVSLGTNIYIENATQSFYEDGRYCIVFHGKIDNIQQLGNELEGLGHQFTEHDEAEILLILYTLFKEEMVDKIRGSFVFLIWDREESQLFAVRDHFGIKPLYFIETETFTCFSTEKKSILKAIDRAGIDLVALQHYMSFQFPPEPYTITEGIQRLLPGHYLIKKPGYPVNIKRYWQATFHPVEQPVEQWVKELRTVLKDAVSEQIQPDEKVGIFLSGGIDSTLITALAKEVHPNIQTFTVGFRRDGFNEFDAVEETIHHLGIANECLLIEPGEFVKELPKIIWHFGDPLADPASIPTYFLAKMAAEKVDVILSGEGADELFAGYEIYKEPKSLAVFQFIPQPMKRILRWIAELIPDGIKGKSFFIRGTTPLEYRYIGNAKIFTEEEKKRILHSYRENVHFTDITKPLYQEIADYSPICKMQYIDIHTWLNGDILMNVERMTRAHSLQLRVPFLSLPVFEVARKIPDSLKIARGQTKYLLRKVSKGIVPDHIVNRKKLGFPVPIRHWLKNELYDWALEVIEDSETDGYINKKYLYSLLEEHRQGKRDHSRKIWTVLCFMVWHGVFFEEKYAFAEEKVTKRLRI